MMGRGSWGAGWLPTAGAMPMVVMLAIGIASAAISSTRLETGNFGLETGLKWHCTTTLERLRQETAHIAIG